MPFKDEMDDFTNSPLDDTGEGEAEGIILLLYRHLKFLFFFYPNREKCFPKVQPFSEEKKHMSSLWIQRINVNQLKLQSTNEQTIW